MNEIWRPIRGYEGYYEVSIKGVRSIRRPGSLYQGKMLSVHLRTGYPSVLLSKDGKRQHKRIHRVLAEAFIPNPDNLPEVNHKDGNRENFALENLEWCTPAQNQKHAIETGLRKKRPGRPPKTKLKREPKRRFKLTVEQEEELVLLRSTTDITLPELSIRFGLSEPTISKYLKRRDVRKPLHALSNGQMEEFATLRTTTYMTLNEIAQRFGISKGTAGKYAQKLGLKKPKKPRAPRPKKEWVNPYLGPKVIPETSTPGYDHENGYSYQWDYVI